jgi:hypothetical protein
MSSCARRRCVPQGGATRVSRTCVSAAGATNRHCPARSIEPKRHALLSSHFRSHLSADRIFILALGGRIEIRQHHISLGHFALARDPMSLGRGRSLFRLASAPSHCRHMQDGKTQESGVVVARESGAERTAASWSASPAAFALSECFPHGFAVLVRSADDLLPEFVSDFILSSCYFSQEKDLTSPGSNPRVPRNRTCRHKPTHSVHKPTDSVHKT